MTPEEILKKHTYYKPKSLYETAVIKAMEEYANQQLSEVLKEKNEEVETANKMYVASRIANQTLYAKNQALQSQLSQLQSSMEEEKRKAFEAGRQRVYNSWDFDLKRSPNEYDNKYSTYEDYLKSTPSTEGK